MGGIFAGAAQVNLSPHFTLDEFTASDSAARRGINNGAPPSVLPNLKRCAAGLELIRAQLNNNAIRVSSGYRCEALERVLCVDAFYAWCRKKLVLADDKAWATYFAGKQHPTGNAVDFTCASWGPPERILRLIASNTAIQFDQLILEYPQHGGWLHVSFTATPRRQVLVVDGNGTRSYS
jgi:hypothetical protein